MKRKVETYAGGILVMHTDEDNFRQDGNRHQSKISKSKFFFIRNNDWDDDLYRMFKSPPRDTSLAQLGIEISNVTWVTMTQGDFLALSLLVGEQ